MANGVLAGLFGGQSPYPVSPQMRQGLLGDAGRSAGIALLANAMNPNIGQGLAAALAAGRQTYQGGAQEAYQVGRQEEQFGLQRDVLEARGEYYRARADAEKQEAQAMVEEMAADERGLSTMRQKLVEAGFSDAALWGRKQVEDAFKRLVEERFEQKFPEPEKVQQPELRSGASPLLSVSYGPDGQPIVNTIYTPPEREAAAGGVQEPETAALAMPSETTLFNRLAKLVEEETKAARREATEADMPMATPEEVSARARERLQSELGQLQKAATEDLLKTDFGAISVPREALAPVRTPPEAPDQPQAAPEEQAKALVDAALPSLTDADRKTVERLRSEGTPEPEILRLLAQAGY